MTSEQLKALNGLYTNNLVRHKYAHTLTEAERKDIRAKNEDFAQQLDALVIPWSIQNAVAYASEQSKNWARYNRDVINEIISNYERRCAA